MEEVVIKADLRKLSHAQHAKPERHPQNCPRPFQPEPLDPGAPVVITAEEAVRFVKLRR